MLHNLTPDIGTVVDIDLKHLDDIDKIYDLAIDRKVLIFRNQTIEDSQLLTLIKKFGDLFINPVLPTQERDGRYYQHNDKDWKANENTWHVDQSWMANPSVWSMLKLLKGPETGGDILFTDLNKIYNNLDRDRIERLKGEYARHSHPWDDKSVIRWALIRGYTKSQARDIVKQYKYCDHPIVKYEKTIDDYVVYVNPGFTVTDSDDIRLIYNLYYKPENNCRWKYTAGDVILWNNRLTAHYAVQDYYPQSRSFVKVSTSNDYKVD